MSQTKIQTIEAMFQSPRVRRARLGTVWLYSIVDLLGQVDDVAEARALWEGMKGREPKLAGLARKVKVAAAAGMWVETDMVDVGGALRIFAALPWPLGESIKKFLAEAGKQVIEEQADPELALRRTRRLYEAKGHSPEWVEKRLRGLGARHELTRQWARRGASDSEHYRVLTNELMRGLFGMDVEHYRRSKGLGAANLRDHMSDMELALMGLGETTASILHQRRDSRGIEELMEDAHDAGAIAARTREEIERRLGRRRERVSA